ncbi:transcription elongation factor GreA [Candidatus Parcubacteria bacterium]|nr:MAG: transcription elongation factor GreA [Candidatus Parcubacteria bacterium]
MRKLRRIPFTKEGLENLKIEYQKILDERPNAVKTLADARELGDLSENGLYKAARARLSSIDANLRRIDITIKLAEVEEPEKGIVGVGSKVFVNDGEKNRDFSVVGKYETDPLRSKVSDESPIGRALMNKKVGDVVNIHTPKGKISFKILKIE